MRAAILTTKEAGVFKQAEGLCERLGFAPYHWVVPRLPMRLPAKWWQRVVRVVWRKQFELMPWQEEEVGLIVSCGKHSVAAAMLAKQYFHTHKKPITLVHIQNPHCDLAQFDLVIAPRHDGLRGANVITTRGSIHSITPEGLKREAKKWRLELGSSAKPLTVVLLGGKRRFSVPSTQFAGKFGDELSQWHSKVGGSLLILPSYRTPKKFLTQLLARLAVDSWRVLVPSKLGNPYVACLALAEHIVVSGDSVNMVSEAVATNKPVWVRVPPDLRSKRLLGFNETLVRQQFVAPFEGKPAKVQFTKQEGNEMGEVIRAVKKRLKL